MNTSSLRVAVGVIFVETPDLWSSEAFYGYRSRLGAYGSIAACGCRDLEAFFAGRGIHPDRRCVFRETFFYLLSK